MLHVELALDELRREPVEQLGVGGRIARADVVNRLDDAHPEQVTPQAVDITLGKIRVVRAGHPRGEFLSARGFLLLFILDREGKFRSGDCTCALMFDVAIGFIKDFLVESFLAFHSGAADGCLVGFDKLIVFLLCSVLLVFGFGRGLDG